MQQTTIFLSTQFLYFVFTVTYFLKLQGNKVLFFMFLQQMFMFIQQITKITFNR